MIAVLELEKFVKFCSLEHELKSLLKGLIDDFSEKADDFSEKAGDLVKVLMINRDSFGTIGSM